jgi:predicted AAA+ superfamily ATPase
LSLQVGSEISLNELANTLQTNRRTVERYIDLLEKAFVVFRLRSFSRNLRKEIAKSYKVYFFDLGIRNSIIQQYQSIDLRNDKGAIWENFLIVERMKFLQQKQVRPNRYFWRTHDRQEIDYIEEMDGQLTAFEFKWGTKKSKVPGLFLKTYPNSTIQTINRENFESFILS